MVLKNNFADRLIDAVDKKKNPSSVGLDPDFSKIPGSLKKRFAGSCEDPFRSAAEAVWEFNKKIIDAVCDIVPCIKIQIAYYEKLGAPGIEVFKRSSDYAASKDLIVIADAKRNDIGSTCAAYSSAFLGETELFGTKKRVFDCDALTVSAYLGFDGIEPFIEDCKNYGKGIFIIVKTSNKGSSEFQCASLKEGGKNFEFMGRFVSQWGKDLKGEKGYSSIGAVAGATFPREAEILRKIMPDSIFLVPGYGAQGGTARDVMPCFNRDGSGALVNSSRNIIFAFKDKDDDENFDSYARQAAIAMREEIKIAMQREGICRWEV